MLFLQENQIEEVKDLLSQLGIDDVSTDDVSIDDNLIEKRKKKDDDDADYSDEWSDYDSW